MGVMCPSAGLMDGPLKPMPQRIFHSCCPPAVVLFTLHLRGAHQCLDDHRISLYEEMGTKRRVLNVSPCNLEHGQSVISLGSSLMSDMVGSDHRFWLFLPQLCPAGLLPLPSPFASQEGMVFLFLGRQSTRLPIFLPRFK